MLVLLKAQAMGSQLQHVVGFFFFKKDYKEFLFVL